MTIVNVQFNLDNDSSDKHDLELYLAAHKLYSSLSDIKDFIRTQLKHCDHPENVNDMLEKIRDMIDFGGLEC